VVAGRVRNAARNVSPATVLGTLASAVVYILGTLAVFGTVSHAALLTSTAPFTDAANTIVGGRWAGNAVAIAAIISGFGCLVGWTLIAAEMPRAAAVDGLFPTPFAQHSRRGVPALGVIAATVLASVLTIVSYTSFDRVFTTIVLLTVLTAVIPYLFSAAAQLYWLLTARRRLSSRRLARDLLIVGLAMAFSFCALAGSGTKLRITECSS
jgi:basic amino acid/polyamine antiporter, APA family